MLTLDVYAAAHSGARREGEIALARLPRLATSLARTDGALRWRTVSGTDGLGRPALQLRLDATLPLRCDRCERELDFELAVEREFYFVASEAELAAIEVDDAPEEPLLGSAHFDLGALIEDEAILQLPLSPRHAGCAPAAEADGASAPDRVRPFSGLQGLRDELRRAAPARPPKKRARA
jgi:uncharacterized protein